MSPAMPEKQWNHATRSRARPMPRWSQQSRATAQAAPKPLSMPTTVMPAAHDDSIGEQRRDALQRGAVADARRDGDDAAPA